MKKSLWFSACIILFTLQGCLDTPDEQPQIGQQIEIGDFRVNPSTIENFIYTGKYEMVYKDSLGHQMHMFLFEEPLASRGKLQLIKDDPDSSGKIYYNYTSDVKKYILKNDSFNLKFTMEIDARPFNEDPESGFVADILNIYSPDLVKQPALAFYFELDQRTWPKSYLPNPLGQIELYGKTFNNVYNTTITKPFSIIQFNREVGIVSFTDEVGIRWRFDRFL